jgi:hypothetical protein
VNWTPFLWLAATFLLLALVERWIHRHLQGVALLVAGDREVAVVLYAVPLFPGVVLHELSHAVAALLLGARVGSISLRPKLAGQRIQLGFVPVERTGPVRGSLIGLAPLLVGSGVILAIGYGIFGLDTVSAALADLEWGVLTAGLRGTLNATDAWIWFYVIFAVSNTMMPSRSDRQSWAPVVLYLALVGFLILVSGIGPAVAAKLAEPVTIGVRWLAAMTTLTILVDLPFMVAIALSERVVSKVKGVRVTYGG